MSRLTSVGVAVLGSGLIAITYGLARFVFGLFLPAIRDDMTLTPTLAGVIGALPFVSFVLAVIVAPVVLRALGVRLAATLAAGLALAGLATIARAPMAGVLAIGVLVCGISTGLSSPVMAEAVQRLARPGLRGRVNAFVNAGTSLGIALAMPAVLLWAGAWRTAYSGFAVLAAVGMVATLACLPGARDTDAEAPRSRSLRSIPADRWGEVARLSALAGAMGVVSAAYWVFAPDAVVKAGGLGTGQTAWMWLAVGVGGLLGGGAGDLISRMGAAASHALALGAMSGAIALLVFDPGAFSLAMVSAAVFGAGYMTLTGFHLVRSTQVMADAPALGPVLPLLATSSGQVVGSPLAGWLISAGGYVTAFAAFAAVGLGTALLSWHLAAPRAGDVRYP